MILILEYLQEGLTRDRYASGEVSRAVWVVIG
jgi:hypothetical protein